PVSRSEFQVGYGSSFESAIHAWTVAAVPAVSFNVSFQVPEEIDGLSPGFEPAGGRMETKITPRSVAVGVLEVTPTGLRSSVSLSAWSIAAAMSPVPSWSPEWPPRLMLMTAGLSASCAFSRIHEMAWMMPSDLWVFAIAMSAPGATPTYLNADSHFSACDPSP